MAKKSTSYTIDEIAAAAGVSKATVSRVMNGSANVSASKKKIVEQTIKRLGFEPNPNARKLAGGTGGSIALVLEESTEEFFMNPFWKDVVTGFIDETSRAKLHPVLFFHSKDEEDRDLVNALVRGNYDAIAIFGWHRDIRILEKYIPDRMTIVFGGKQGESTRFTYVGVDNVEGGAMATKHLIDIGAKKILTITGDLTVESGRERLAGYKKALTTSGIKYQENLVLRGDYSQESAVKVLRSYLSKACDFDAIFAANDLMAIGAIKVLKEFKIDVPGQVKVIGFDGTELAEKHVPAISTISQPSVELGTQVAKNLVAAIKKKKISDISLQMDLLIRASTQV